MSITHLDTQAQFEALWFNTDEATKEKPWIVYFTAAWCGPCKRLDLVAIADAATAAGLPFYKCDYVVNDYTSGYCGVRAFPTFVYMKPRKILGQHKSAETAEVVGWIQGLKPETAP